MGIFFVVSFLYFSSSLISCTLHYTLQKPCCLPSCFFCGALHVPQLSGGGSVPWLRLQTVHKKVYLDMIAQYFMSPFTSLMLTRSSSPPTSGAQVCVPSRAAPPPPPSPSRPPDAPPSAGRGRSERAKGPRTAGKRRKDTFLLW